MILGKLDVLFDISFSFTASPDGAFRAVERQAHAVCDYIVRPPNVTDSSNISRGIITSNGSSISDVAAAAAAGLGRWSGFFSTSTTAWKVWPAPCSFTFPAPMPGHSIQINLLTYNIT